MNSKISEFHLSKPAYIYLRQSTPGQVRHHQQSTERQYGLREKALQLGWTEASIHVLDRDLGFPLEVACVGPHAPVLVRRATLRRELILDPAEPFAVRVSRPPHNCALANDATEID